MPGNLRYGLTSGLSTASKKWRPGSHYLESPFLLSKYGPNCSPVSFHLPLGILLRTIAAAFDSIFLGVYYTDNTQYITLCTTPPPPTIPRNAMILQDLLLSTRGVWT